MEHSQEAVAIGRALAQSPPQGYRDRFGAEGWATIADAVLDTGNLRGAVAENEKLRLQVAALENDGMELAARLGEAEEQIARLTTPGGQ